MIIKHINEININLLNTWFNLDSPIIDFEVSNTYETILSTLVHFSITLKNTPDQPRFFLIKMTKLNSNGEPNGRGKKEVQFYKELSGIINKKNVPNCYYAESDDSGYYNIVMDDLSKTHDTESWGDNILNQYKLVAQCLAEIHAKWWDHNNLENIVGSKLSLEEWQDYYIKSLERTDIFIEIYKDLFEPEHIATYNKYKDIFYINIDRYLAEKNLTLQHRDPHFWNFMYPKNQQGNVYLIDWDSYRIDVPTHDIAYFIAVHFSREERSKYEDKILEYYHEQLLLKGVQDYSFDNLYKDYKTSVVSMIFLSSFKESIGIPQKVWHWQFENIIDAIEDLNCFELVEQKV